MFLCIVFYFIFRKLDHTFIKFLLDKRFRLIFFKKNRGAKYQDLTKQNILEKNRDILFYFILY